MPAMTIASTIMAVALSAAASESVDVPIPVPPAATVRSTPEVEWPRPPTFSVSALIQMREQQTSVTIQPGLAALVMQQFPDPAVSADTLRLMRDTARERDGLRPRRLLLDAAGTPADRLSWQVRLDFARLIYEDPTQLVRWAYGQLATSDRVVLTVGIFDIPFSLFETMDESEIELAERGPTHELLHHLRLTERDLGALVTVSPLREKRWLQGTAGLINGGADGGQSYRGPGLLAARLLSEPVRHLRLGAGLVWRPRPLTAWWEELRFYYQSYDKGVAYGTDATLTFQRVVVRAEWIAGDRTDNDVMVPLMQRRGDARTFMSAWVMVVLRFWVGPTLIRPTARAEWLDTDREHPTGEIVHLSAALNVDVSARVRLLLDLSRHYVQIGTRNWEFNVVRYDTDATTGVLQLQMWL